MATNPYEAPEFVEAGDPQAAKRTLIATGCFIVMSLCGMALVVTFAAEGGPVSPDALARTASEPVIAWLVANFLANLVMGIGIWQSRSSWAICGLSAIIGSSLIIGLMNAF